MLRRFVDKARRSSLAITSTRKRGAVWAMIVGRVALTISAVGAAADVVHYTNGDRLTGKLLDSAADVVAIEVPNIGVVKAPKALVDRIEVDIADSAGEDAVQGDPAPSAQVVADTGWKARADLGVAVATGNTQAADFNFVAGAERNGRRFDNIFGIAVHQAKAKPDGKPHPVGGTVTTKDRIDLDYNLRWKYGDTWYAAANFEYFQDPIKDIDQRATTGAGVGHTFWESARGALRTDAGVSRVFEQVGGDAGEARAGSSESDNNPALRWSLQFNRWLVEDRLEVFHNNQLLHVFASEPSSVWDSDTGIRFHLNSRWLAALRVDLQHETAPAAGRRKTDSSYALAVGVKL